MNDIKFFGILLLSCFFTFAAMIPFINLLYQLKFKTPKVKSEDIFGKKTIFNKLHGAKAGTPTGGGILVILVSLIFVAIFYSATKFTLNWTSTILFLTLIIFGLWGFYDDFQKFFFVGKGKDALGLRIRHKAIIQLLISFIPAFLLYSKMGVDGFALPFGTEIQLGIWYIPLMALFITFFSNAFNITDGLDGLSSGLLIISLTALWYLAGHFKISEDLNLFIVVLFGASLPFLYFNINPARVFMGDTGALAFGAFLAVAALIIKDPLAFIVIGGVFVVEALSSLTQWGSMLLRNGKRLFRIAPLHHHFEALGWDETKVTMRFWLAGGFLAVLGIFFALL